MKTLQVFFLIALLSSCAQVKYGINVGASQFNYSENISVDPPFTLSTNVPEYKSKGYQGEIGITEETKFFLTKINFLYARHDGDNFTVDNTSFPGAKMTETGYEIQMTIKLWYFRPSFGLVGMNQKYTVKDGSASEKLNYSGYSYGIGFEIPMSEKSFFFAHYKQNILDKNPVELIGVNREHQVISVGFRFNLFTIEGKHPF